MLLLASGLVFAALLAAGLSIAGSSTESPVSASLPGLSPEELARLRDLAIRTAADMGEPHPTDGVVVATTQHTFFEAQGGPEFGTPDFDVYVVAFRGDFTAGGVSRPAGAAAPRGRAVHGVYNARTLELTDWGIGQEMPNTSGIGPSIPLPLN